MTISVLFLLLGVPAVGAPVVTIGHAVEVYRTLLSNETTCFYDKGYKVLLLRAYNTKRYANSTAINAKRAEAANLSYEIYMVPDPGLNKSLSQQFEELSSGLSKGGLPQSKRIWIEVSHPKRWSSHTSKNIEILQNLLREAKVRKRSVGIMTNRDEFEQITGGINIGSYDMPLWYLEPKGCHVNLANFDNFEAFGGWYKPVARRYCTAAIECGMIVGKSVVMGFVFPPWKWHLF